MLINEYKLEFKKVKNCLADEFCIASKQINVGKTDKQTDIWDMLRLCIGIFLSSGKRVQLTSMVLTRTTVDTSPTILAYDTLT